LKDLKARALVSRSWGVNSTFERDVKKRLSKKWKRRKHKVRPVVACEFLKLVV